MNETKLIELLGVQSASLKQFRMFARIIRELKLTPEVQFYVRNGNIYAIKGNAPRYPAVVAHMDTVHKLIDDLVVVQMDRKVTGFNPVTMRQSGIGGDDKVGVFIALEVLRMSEAIKVVFFRDEEIGCAGSNQADADFFFDCNFILQCDRHGFADFIVEIEWVPLSSQAFQDAVEPLLRKYGYKVGSGRRTDVLALKAKGINCSMANISCGYFRPHHADEFVHLDCVSVCLDLVLEIIDRFGNRYFPHRYKRPVLMPIKRARRIPSRGLCPICCVGPTSETGYCESCSDCFGIMLGS